MRGISSPELKEIVTLSRAQTRQSQASRDNMNLVEVAMECYLNLSVSRGVVLPRAKGQGLVGAVRSDGSRHESAGH